MPDRPLTDDEKAVFSALLTLLSQTDPKTFHAAELVIARAMVKAKVLNDLIIRQHLLSRPHPKTGAVEVCLAPSGLLIAYHCQQQRGF